MTSNDPEILYCYFTLNSGLLVSVKYFARRRMLLTDRLARVWKAWPVEIYRDIARFHAL